VRGSKLCEDVQGKMTSMREKKISKKEKALYGCWYLNFLWIYLKKLIDNFHQIETMRLHPSEFLKKNLFHLHYSYNKNWFLYDIAFLWYIRLIYFYGIWCKKIDFHLFRVYVTMLEWLWLSSCHSPSKIHHILASKSSNADVISFLFIIYYVIWQYIYVARDNLMEKNIFLNNIVITSYRFIDFCSHYEVMMSINCINYYRKNYR